MTSVMPPGESADTATAIRDFYAQGFVILRSVIPRDQTLHLQELVEQRYQDPRTHGDEELDLVRGDISLMRMFEFRQEFRTVLTSEPILSLVESVLGPDCHVVAQNALRTPKGRGILRWHIDDALFFPFLEHLPPIPRDVDPLPCYSMNVMVALSDVESECFGPTQVVSRSHLTGRAPEHDPRLPPGMSATSLLTRAGDVCLVNSQTWHRGAQNRSDRIRYLLSTTYGRRFISQRFFPFLNYQMPKHVLDSASGRLLRLLGKHEKGPYG